MNDLIVLDKSKELSYKIYYFCRNLPINEQYIIIPQLLKAAISIPSNIAEGSQRGKKEFVHFLKIARGSLYELKVQLDIINHVYGISDNNIILLCDEIGKMTYSLINSLKEGK